MPIIKIKNSAIRCILGFPKYTRTTPLYKSLGLLKFQDINKYTLTNFMYKYHMKTLPSIFLNYFQLNGDIHNYNTHQRNKLHVPRFKSTIGQMSFYSNSIHHWNTIGLILLESCNFHLIPYIFKKRLKHFLLYPTN